MHQGTKFSPEEDPSRSGGTEVRQKRGDWFGKKTSKKESLKWFPAASSQERTGRTKKRRDVYLGKRVVGGGEGRKGWRKEENSLAAKGEGEGGKFFRPLNLSAACFGGGR